MICIYYFTEMSIFTLYKSARAALHRYLRQRMMPMTVDQAEERREFFAKLYCLSAFCAFVYSFYEVYNKTMHDRRISPLPIGEAAIEKLKIDGKVRVINIEGFKKVADYTYERKEDKDENTQLIASPASTEESQPELSYFKEEFSQSQDS